MEYWPCLIDIVYYSAKIITKLIENHSLFIYYNSNTQTYWTVALSGVIFWHQHTPCSLSAAGNCGFSSLPAGAFVRKYLRYGCNNSTLFVWRWMDICESWA